MEYKDLIKYLKSLGIEVHTTTKARGHHGFFLKNRIDISKNVPPHRKTQTLIHEFAHYIHSKLEPNMEKTGGSLDVLFQTSSDEIKNELMKVTHFVDENSLHKKLEFHKSAVKQKIKEYEKIIKSDYPNFMRSKRFKEFEKYIKKTDAKYLLKYDRIKLIKGFFHRSVKIYTITDIEKDFPTMPKAFVAYIRLHSCQKKQSRISARINKSNKYYSRVTELFARFVEGLYVDREYVEQIAPKTTHIFCRLLNENYYGELQTVICNFL